MEQQIDINRVLEKLRQRLSDEVVRSSVLEIQLDACREQIKALTEDVPEKSEETGLEDD